jgi:hypothetical protein
MYEQAYKKTTSLADQIRLGATQQRRTTDESLINPRLNVTSGIEEGGEESRRQQMDMQALMARYVQQVRNPDLPEGTSVPQFAMPQLEGDLAMAMRALGTIESSNNYQAIGPVTRSGHRAYGKYQIMDFNIPEWTEQAIGYRMTPEEFLASPEAQEATTAYHFGNFHREHGTWEDAASVWFSGRPMAKAGNASDGWATVPEYVEKFRRNFR